VIRLIPWLAFFALLLIPIGASAKFSYGFSIETGIELDSNATRLTIDQPQVMAGLGRLVLNGRLGWTPAPNHALSFWYGAGGKLFWDGDADQADEVLHYGGVGWSWALSRAFVFSLQGYHYDSYQQGSIQDFRTAAASTGLKWNRSSSGTSLAVGLGYRGFQYKPDDNYDFHSAKITANFLQKLTSGIRDTLVDWQLRADYRLAWRMYRDYQLLPPTLCPEGGPPICSMQTDIRRMDWNHLFRFGANYVGNAVASLWYSLEINQSNSYGKPYFRHAVGLSFTTPLLWEVYLSVKGVVQLSQFIDPYLILQTSGTDYTAVDDENRSSLVVQVSRDVIDDLTLLLRYGAFVNEASTVSGYLRHIWFLGIRYQLSSE
jgi:hypothetical protein